jgi:Cytochrome b subunit of formate dehydrogenase
MKTQSSTIVRFDRLQRFEHFAVMSIFIVLAITGFPQKFYDHRWAQVMMGWLGGVDIARWCHRAAGIAFALLLVVHIARLVAEVALGKSSLSMVPTKQDFADAVQTLRYYVGATDKPAKFDRFDYRQKFEYWGLLLGSGIVVGTGLVLLLPILTARFLPGEVIPAAYLAHSQEGLMAFLVVIVWHIYNAHLSPDVFPFDTSIFTGKISAERMHHEHPLEYERRKPAEPERETKIA